MHYLDFWIVIRYNNYSGFEPEIYSNLLRTCSHAGHIAIMHSCMHAHVCAYMHAHVYMLVVCIYKMFRHTKTYLLLSWQFFQQNDISMSNRIR